MREFPYTILVTSAALLLYIYIIIRVSTARTRTKIEAPATTGSPEFERLFRVQMNMLEWFPIFLAGLWISAAYWGDIFSSALGVVWIAGRLIYLRAYMADPKKRGLGFDIQGVAALVLVIAAAAGAIRILV